jgi:hypothetical protein
MILFIRDLKYRSQPSVGCPQLTLKSLINSIILNLLSVALVDIEIPVRKYRSQPFVGCPLLTLKSLLDSIVLNLLSVALS